MRLSAFYGCSAAKMCFVYRQVRWRAVLKQVCGKICSGGGKRRAAKGQGSTAVRQRRYFAGNGAIFIVFYIDLKSRLKISI
jgi:hypothetical protein